jgi:dihydrofolate synthase/folylpolyglutamate synthase
VVEPEVAVITNVEMDHTEILGPTRLDIAREKAGIFKRGCRLVIGETDPELGALFSSVAADVRAAELWRRGPEFACEANRLAVGGRLLDLRTPGGHYEGAFLPLHGAHQGENASCALAAAEAFFGGRIDARIVEEAFANVHMPGRMEIVGRSPLVVLDGAHNPAGARVLAEALDEEFDVQGPVIAVVGILRGRDPYAILQPLASAGIRNFIACTAPSPRSMPASDVASAARRLGCNVSEAGEAVIALEQAMDHAGESGMVVVTGSLYVVAAARGSMLGGGTGDHSSS